MAKKVVADIEKEAEQPAKAPEEELSIEDAFERLEELAQKLDDRETSLEDSFLLYREGMSLLKMCSQKLDTVEKKMLQINEDGSFSAFSVQDNG